MTLISVVIPTYDSGWCVGAAIRSVLDQSFQDFEIIVVDDGSNDDTRERVAAIADARLSYLFQQNVGRAAARNTGIARAVGEWVAFLDADDLWLPGKLQRQVDEVRAYPQAGMVYSQVAQFAKRIPDNGAPCDLGAASIRGSGVAGLAQRFSEFLLGEADVVTSSVMARRSDLAYIGGFDSQFKIVEDWDLFMRLAQRGPIVYIDQVLAAYWRGPFENQVDRARKYDWHHELLDAVRKNIAQSGLERSQPVVAAQSLAVWNWITALIEFRLGNLDNANRHAAVSYARDQNFFRGERAAKLTAEHILDARGRDIAVPPFARELRDMLKGILPAPERDTLYRKSLGYLHITRAYQCYFSGNVAGGLSHALHAVRWDQAWLRNRGLWVLPIRKLLASPT